jgi:uncharacterized membrane protein YqjE
VTDDADRARSKAGQASGLLASLRQLLGTFTEILHTRVEIISIELEEEGWRIRHLIFYGLVAFLFLGLGVLMATLFVVGASPETYQLYIVGGFAMLYLGVGAIAALAVRRSLRNRPRLFSTTLSELEKDRNSLKSRP